MRLQQEEDRIQKLDPGDKERTDQRQKVLSDKQELEWRARQEKVSDTRGHRETALDGYIKVKLVLKEFSDEFHDILGME